MTHLAKSCTKVQKYNKYCTKNMTHLAKSCTKVKNVTNTEKFQFAFKRIATWCGV